jgi:hypothetical protein
MYKGFCVVKIGDKFETMPPVVLEDIEECVNYVMLQKKIVKEVIIADEDEYCIIHAVDGKVVFPEKYAGM